MTTAQIELLVTIARGEYLPTLNSAILTTLAALFRRGFVRYGGETITITTDGISALQKALAQ